MSRSYCFALALCISINSAPAVAIDTATRGLQRFVANSGAVISHYKNSYALLIGNSEYESYAWDSLQSIPRELDQVSDALSAQGFEIIRRDNLDTAALRQEMREFVIKYGSPDNRLLVFYSGHGYTEQRGSVDVGYLVPVDAPDPSTSVGGLGTRALSMGEIVTWAKESPAKHILYVFDSCFSGAVLNTRSHLNASRIPPHLEHAMAEPARQFITAGAANQPVPAVSQFAQAFVNGLKFQKADLTNDGYITGTELGLYIREQVAQLRNGQTPQYGTILEPRFRVGEVLFNGGALGEYQPSANPAPITVAHVIPPSPQPAPINDPQAMPIEPAPTLLNLEEPEKKINWLLAIGGLVAVGALLGGSGGSDGGGSDEVTIRIPTQ